MTSNDFRKTLIAVMNMKISETEQSPVYEENKYNYGEYLEGLNEGYLAGMREALRVLEASEFLAV